MSDLRIPPFDVLVRQPEPYPGFGVPVVGQTTMEHEVRSNAEEARCRLEEGFGCCLSNAACVPAELDSLIDEMWAQGWDPEVGDVDLFARDFGLVLTQALLEAQRGVIVFRSDRDVSHVSIWWADMQVEAFPFHAVGKRLADREGGSLQSFANELSGLLSDNEDPDPRNQWALRVSAEPMNRSLTTE